jgi:hypothetical protein
MKRYFVIMALIFVATISYAQDFTNRLMLRGWVVYLGASVETGILQEQANNEKKTDGYTGYRYNLYFGRFISNGTIFFAGVHLFATFNNPNLITNRPEYTSPDTTGLAGRSYIIGMGKITRQWYTSMKFLYTDYETSTEEHPFGTGKSVYYSTGIEFEFSKLILQHIAVGVYLREEQGKADLNFSNDFNNLSIGFGIQYIGF